MRIKSNYRDYYDCMQKYVVGDSSVYIRNWIECEITPNLKRISFDDFQICVGFCGTLYYGVKRFIYKHNKSTQIKYFLSVKDFCGKDFSKETIRRASTFIKTEVSDELFIAENAPILFMEYNIGVISCPLETKNRMHCENSISLESIGFDKLVSKEDAYTQLCGYIGGVLGREHKTVPEMSDNVKIHSHGFDETSFRRG